MMMTMMASARTAAGAARCPPTLKQIARSRHLAAVDGATADRAIRRRRRFKVLLLLPACAADCVSLARAGAQRAVHYSRPHLSLALFQCPSLARRAAAETPEAFRVAFACLEPQESRRRQACPARCQLI